MNKILKLLDKDYVRDLFSKKVLPKYPGFKEIKKIKITKHKNNIWEKTYHVVFEYKVCFVDHDDQENCLAIFAVAHSEETRKDAFVALEYLWQHGFGDKKQPIPHPLFYSNYFKAIFYRGLEGKNLYYFIKNKRVEKLKILVPKVAKWLSKLHQLPTEEAKNFNNKNSRLRTVVPGVKHILWRLENNYPQYYDLYKKAYKHFIKREGEYFKKNKFCLIHGDAHPENIIRVGRSRIGVIDFSDICLGDFARDLGCFLQQIEYMCRRKIDDEEFIKEIKELFLKTYLKSAKITLSEDLRERIENYHDWTSLRTATVYLLREKPSLEKAEFALKELKTKFE